MFRIDFAYMSVLLHLIPSNFHLCFERFKLDSLGYGVLRMLLVDELVLVDLFGPLEST